MFGRAPADQCSAAAGAICSYFPATRAFMMLVAIVMLVSLWLLITRTRVGMVIQAALTHPEMVEALGHNVPRVFMLVFGAGTALAGLAGVIGGSTFVTEPAMALTLGSLIFVVVVVGGMGSLTGAYLAALLIGVLQAFGIVLVPKITLPTGTNRAYVGKGFDVGALAAMGGVIGSGGWTGNVGLHLTPADEIGTVSLGSAIDASAGGWIHLDDLEPLASPLELNALVVAERLGGPGDELVQLDLDVHQRVKGAQIPQGFARARRAGFEEDRSKMPRDRPPDAVVRQLQR
jgi:hypothetical protein